MTFRKMLLALFLLFPWLALLILLPLYPGQAIEAALRGVAIWWEVLFPALFPFFVIAELLLGFGVVHYIGCLFDPLMRPVFRVPGVGGFVMAMGFASGYPIGARLTSQLWEAGLVNREEGERLVASTSTSDPIFLIGAVSVGFFHHPGLAAVLAASHYGGGLLLGLLMRWHGRRSEAASDKKGRGSPGTVMTGKSIWRRAFAAMHEARLSDQRSAGQLLQSAVQAGLKLVFMIGGLVVFISVMLEMLTLTGVLDKLQSLAAGLLALLALPPALAGSLVSGIFEVTLGAKAAGAAEGTALMHRAAMASFVLSWAGLSVHAQIASLLTSTNLRYAPFLAARLLHGCISMLLVYALWRPLGMSEPAAAAAGASDWTAGSWLFFPDAWRMPAILFGSCLALLALGSLAAGAAVVIRGRIDYDEKREPNTNEHSVR